MMRVWAAMAAPELRPQMSTPSPAVIARADQFQANAPHRTLRQWQAMVEHNENLLADSLSWFDADAQIDSAALSLVRDRLAFGGAR